MNHTRQEYDVKDEMIKVTIYIPKEFYLRMRQLAGKNQRTFSAQVRFLLEQWAATQEGQSPQRLQ
jgi:hypothetical protein